MLMGMFRIVCMCLALCAMAQTSVAQMKTDAFGQKVSKLDDKQVSKARDLRIPNYGAGFDIDKSISILTKIVEGKPSYYRAWYNLGLAYNANNNRDKSSQAFNKAIGIQEAASDIKDGSIYNTFGWVLLNNREYENAEKILLKGLEFKNQNTKKTNSALFYNLGRLYFEMRVYPQSMKYLSASADTYGNPAAIELKEIVRRIGR